MPTWEFLETDFSALSLEPFKEELALCGFSSSVKTLNGYEGAAGGGGLLR